MGRETLREGFLREEPRTDFREGPPRRLEGRVKVNALPLLPPRAKLEIPPTLKACIAARAALAELKALAGLIPDPSILINSIPLLEAQASSEIENIVTTGDRLFRFADAPSEAGVDPATKETLRYRTALAQGFASLASRPLSTRTAIAEPRRA